MEQITIENGKNGSKVAFADNGKVILIDRKYSNIQVGEVYFANLIEKDRFFIATDLVKQVKGEFVVKDNQLVVKADDNIFPINFSIEFQGFSVWLGKLVNKIVFNIDRNSIPFFITTPPLNKYTHIEDIEKLPTTSIADFKAILNKFGVNDSNIDNAGKKEIQRIEQFINNRIKREEEYKQNLNKLFNGGYKLILKHIENCRKVSQTRKELLEKIDNILAPTLTIDKKINNINNKYNTKITPYDTDGTITIDNCYPKKVVAWDIDKGFKKGTSVIERRNVFIPESEDGFRPEKYVEMDIDVFVEDENADWNIPNDILELPELLKTRKELHKQADPVQSELYKINFPEPDAETKKMLDVCFAELNKSLDFVFDTVRDVDNKTLIEFIENNIIAGKK
jgi:hypothetical protein